MKWEKLVERKGDFLKNYLQGESFLHNFPKVFNRSYADFLTVRKEDTFTNYVDKNSARELSQFIIKQLEINSHFIKDTVKEGKKHFQNLIEFSEKIGKLDHKELDNKELANLIERYFSLYKEPYPYFHLTIYTEELEKKKDNENISLMAGLRFFGRDNFNKTHILINPLFEEIGNRYNLSVNELKFLTPKEILELLNIYEKIERRKNCYLIHKDGEFKLVENKMLVINEDVSNELKGKGTFPGYFKGKVRLIKNKEDIKKINEGDVIVLRMTTPDLITENLKKAGAIITDEGGITCHAAIVSREFNIPALIGTKIATKVLKDGDVVELDTKKGFARKIS